jgi:ABC-type polysaccharide/polyol phosphate export permease
VGHKATDPPVVLVPLRAFPDNRRVKSSFSALLVQRRLLWSLVAMDMRKRYGASSLGFFWSIVNPLLQILVYTFVFGYLLEVNVGGNPGAGNYGVFLFAGMLPWIAFSEAVQRSSATIIENKNLVKQLRFPTALLPLHVLLSSFLHELIAIVIFIGVLFAVGQGPTWWALTLPLLFPLQLILTFGLALIVSALNVFYRDVAQFVAALLTLLFFATPIIYPLAIVPERLRPLFYLNPLTPLISAYRSALLTNETPHLWAFGYLALFSLIVFFVGGLLFQRLSRDFTDLL